MPIPGYDPYPVLSGFTFGSEEQTKVGGRTLHLPQNTNQPPELAVADYTVYMMYEEPIAPGAGGGPGGGKTGEVPIPEPAPAPGGNDPQRMRRIPTGPGLGGGRGRRARRPRSSNAEVAPAPGTRVPTTPTAPVPPGGGTPGTGGTGEGGGEILVWNFDPDPVKISWSANASLNLMQTRGGQIVYSTGRAIGPLTITGYVRSRWDLLDMADFVYGHMEAAQLRGQALRFVYPEREIDFGMYIQSFGEIGLDGDVGEIVAYTIVAQITQDHTALKQAKVSGLLPGIPENVEWIDVESSAKIYERRFGLTYGDGGGGGEGEEPEGEEPEGEETPPEEETPEETPPTTSPNNRPR